MSKRERNLAVVLIAVLGTGAVLFIGYSFILSPLMEKEKLITTKQREITDLEDEISHIMAEKKKYEAIRYQSLPNDPVQGPGVAREEYSKLLESLCRKAGLDNGLNIQVSEPDSKSVPMIANKKPAYTRLSWEVKAKGDEYFLVDFLRLFYAQPLLHQIKTMNLQRPSDQRSQMRRELDIIIKVEALVLDNDKGRATLLPVVREMALLVSSAAYTGYNLHATHNGKGSPLAPAGVLADPPRDYLAIAGKNAFFGPAKVKPVEKEFEPPPQEDLSPYIVLTAITSYEDGNFVATLRDFSTNNNYTVTQSPKGAIEVKGEYELNGKKRFLAGYSEKTSSRNLLYGSPDGGNLRVWRVRRVTASELILEKLDKEEAPALVDEETEKPVEKPKVPKQAYFGGGAWMFVAVQEGKNYSVGLDQCLDINVKKGEEGSKPPPHLGPTFLTSREATRAIYAPLPTPVSTSAVSTPAVKEDRRR
ncbi:MAG TPA: hypothetical protein VHR66_03235 [Gemmataceae bacterium]|jgi:Tfp pilus assembly protein PilO|nr:hypothetical protein [Gemmataceae bacterium]